MPRVDELELRAVMDEALSRWPSVGLAVGVVAQGRLDAFYHNGLADIESRREVTPDTVFRIASISKTMAAVAAMQLCEQGLLDLDAPVTDYLRSYDLVPAKHAWRPATVRHLMTHTAGISEQVPVSGLLRRDFGESVAAGAPVPTLAQYYRGKLPLVAEPGTRFRYTDHGPATLGQVVEDVSGEPFGVYLRNHVFLPLGMADTTLARDQVPEARLATGYRLTSRGPKVVPVRDVIPHAGGGVYSTPADMARYVAALVGGGANEHGSVLKQATLAQMFAPQYQPDPRIAGMGLAFFRGTAGDHAFVEHQGVLPGFDSQIFAAPDDGVGVVAFSNGTRRGTFWLPTELGRLLNRLLGVPDEVIRTDVPQRPDVWGELCGWYYVPGPWWEVRARGMAGAGIEVFVRRDRLTMRVLTAAPALYRGLELRPTDPDDPYRFTVDLARFGLRGALGIVFSRDDGGDVTALHLDAMPLTAHKQPDVLNPRRWAQAAGVVGTAALVARRAMRGRRPG